MKITKQRLKDIIKEELTAEGAREDMMMPAISQADFDAAMATDDEKFTGGSPEERLLTLMKAREVLAAMSREELTALSKSLDAETTRWLQHLLANPMYASMQEAAELNEKLLIPRGTAEEYKQGLRALIKMHGIEKVTRAYKNAGGSVKQVASMKDMKAML